jgi:hypothetical protein
MRKAALLLAAILFISSVNTALAQAPVTLNEYRDRVDRALQLVERATAQAELAAREPLLAQAADLLQVREVQLDNGTRVSVDNTDLAQMVRGATSRPQDAQARLQALRALLMQLPNGTRNADRAKLDEILSKPPFQNSQEPDWLLQLERQIRDFLEHLFSSTANGILDLRDVITLAAVALLLAVLLFLFFNLRRNVVPEASVASGNAGEGNLTSRAALDRAQELAGAGDYRAAVRQLYLATLLVLDERGRLRYDHALTNREYLRVAADEPALAGALQPVVDAFDRIWYGFESVTPQEFESYRERVDTVRKL